MQDYIYSVIAFVAMAIHLIINFGLRADRELNTAHGAREYRGFLKSVFAYHNLWRRRRVRQLLTGRS